MRLLSPQDQKNAEQEEENQQKKSLSNLSEALTRGVKALNAFRNLDKLEREQIVGDHAKFMVELQTKREGLDVEVSNLENRRREALKPLHQIRNELNEREKKLDEKESKLSEKERDLLLKKDEVRELADKYENRLGELTDFKIELDERERNLNEEKKLFERFMRYKESALTNERTKLRTFFEEERSKLKKQKT